MKATVPRKIIDTSGGFEEDDRHARRGWRVTSYKIRHARDLEIVEAANESAFEALGEEIFHKIGENFH